MHEILYSRHAEVRMRQRGYRKGDVDFALSIATPVADDVYLLTDQDAEREITRRKREIQKIERLRGSQFIIANNQLVTLYHATTRSQRLTNRKKRRLS